MGWLIRAILRAFIWRGVWTLTKPRKKGKYSDRNDWS